MRRLFVTFAVLLMTGLAYAAGHAPSALGSNALVIADATPPAPPKPIRIVYPPLNETVATQPKAQVAAAEIDQPLAGPAPQAFSPPAAPQSTSSGLQPNVDAVLQETARVDLNTASVAELDAIPGAGRIGRAIARHRPYRAVDDLLTRHVLRQSVYTRIKGEVAAQ